jgi:8-oxo-dGTP diphosphatase
VPEQRRKALASGRANPLDQAEAAGARQPQVGVGAVVIVDRRVLLVRRGKAPLQGRWMIPGGTVEWGESLEQAVVREVREETGLVVRPREPLAIFDQVHCSGGEVVHHYVIVDFLCDYVSGRALAGSDAREVATVSPRSLAAYRLTADAQRVILEGSRRTAARRRVPRVAERKRGA